jgi:signal transduction histidine kinase
MLSVYERAGLEPSAQAELRQEIERMRQALDLDYLRTDLKSLMEESLEGVQRVRRIVQDLKDFAGAGEGERQAIDLHASIGSTLNLVGAEIRSKAELKLEYGDIPPVTAVPVQLSQVFMNLLINAAQAIETQGLIVVRSGHESGWVWVEIEDNGSGIVADDLPRIFEPFFTTKPVGNGIGLGLSLSYGIIAQHRGRIEVRSEVGKGSTFRVWLPTDAAAA